MYRNKLKRKTEKHVWRRWQVNSTENTLANPLCLNLTHICCDGDQKQLNWNKRNSSTSYFTLETIFLGFYIVFHTTTWLYLWLCLENFIFLERCLMSQLQIALLEKNIYIFILSNQNRSLQSKIFLRILYCNKENIYLYYYNHWFLINE